ncbi:MAG TPA: ATP-binding cassette domain-containing protein, partial [Gemmataceae bacterium]|nr:ATP-binding cassette domain-containing protein [Gemmataceae bacterium]
MPLLRLDDVSLAYGHLPLLAHVDFQIESGERVCLVGRNGTGKTTLLRVIGGTALPDDGEVWRQETLRIGHLEQEVPPDTELTVFEVVATGLGQLGRLLADYHHLTHHAASGGRSSLTRMSELHARIEALDGWNINQKVETVLTRLDLPADMLLTDCSGGIRRQVML